MTIILPKDYHARPLLEKNRILCIGEEQAEREDIRPLNIGIINLMPQADTYEFNLLYPLGRSVLQINPIWIRLRDHAYSSTDRNHLDSLYVSFEQARKQKIDGLIISPAPVEDLAFEEVTYWKELSGIMGYAYENIPSTLGICWGGLALAKHIGIEKESYSRKLFGVFRTKNIDHSHIITGGMDDYFYCPQSRHSGIPADALEDARKKGEVNLLAYSEEAGYTIFEDSRGRFLMHLGHPEYHTTRLIEEYSRDMKKGRDVPMPANLSLHNPVNTWRSHSFEFFSQWIRYIHDSLQR